MSQQQPTNRRYTITECARAIGVSRRTVKDWTRWGYLPERGADRRWPAAAIEVGQRIKRAWPGKLSPSAKAYISAHGIPSAPPSPPDPKLSADAGASVADDWLTAQQVARLGRVSLASVYRYAREGEIPYRKEGHVLLFPRSTARLLPYLRDERRSNAARHAWRRREPSRPSNGNGHDASAPQAETSTTVEARSLFDAPAEDVWRPDTRQLAARLDALDAKIEKIHAEVSLIGLQVVELEEHVRAFTAALTRAGAPLREWLATMGQLLGVPLPSDEVTQ